MAMEKRILYGREAETPEAKARWFQSLSLDERIDLFCEWYELALENNPDIVKSKPFPQPASGRILIVSRDHPTDS